MNNNERELYIESEFKKWQEVYEIPFEQEFNVKALLGLRSQFNAAPDEHVKTKVDLLHAMQKLQHDMKLIPKQEVKELKEKEHILVIVDNSAQLRVLSNIIENCVHIEHIQKWNTEIKITTNKYKLILAVYTPFVRGKRCDYLFNLSSNKDIIKDIAIRRYCI